MKRLIFVVLIICLLSVYSIAYTSLDTAKMVVKSLETEPDNWRHDEYKLYYFKDKTVAENTIASDWDRKADCVVWVANQAYGVRIERPAKVILPKEVREFIWAKYQLWANRHFNEEVFNHLKTEEPEIKNTNQTKPTQKKEEFKEFQIEKRRSVETTSDWLITIIWVAGGFTLLCVFGAVFFNGIKNWNQKNKKGIDK